MKDRRHQSTFTHLTWQVMRMGYERVNLTLHHWSLHVMQLIHSTLVIYLLRPLPIPFLFCPLLCIISKSNADHTWSVQFLLSITWHMSFTFMSSLLSPSLPLFPSLPLSFPRSPHQLCTASSFLLLHPSSFRKENEEKKKERTNGSGSGKPSKEGGKVFNGLLWFL